MLRVVCLGSGFHDQCAVKVSKKKDVDSTDEQAISAIIRSKVQSRYIPETEGDNEKPERNVVCKPSALPDIITGFQNRRRHRGRNDAIMHARNRSAGTHAVLEKGRMTRRVTSLPPAHVQNAGKDKAAMIERSLGEVQGPAWPGKRKKKQI